MSRFGRKASAVAREANATWRWRWPVEKFGGFGLRPGGYARRPNGIERIDLSPRQHSCAPRRRGYRGGELGVLELLDAYRGAEEDEERALDLEFQARRARIELELSSGGYAP